MRRALMIGTALVALTISAPAGATGPTYPGETLSLAAQGTPTANTALSVLATGQQADVASTVGGFDFHAFVKNAATDPTCSPSFTGEENTSISEPGEQALSGAGSYQGPDPTFSIPFKVFLGSPGTLLVCGYSEYLGDTAATATMTIVVPGAAVNPAPTPTGTTPAPTPTPTPPPTSTKKRPADLRKPTITASSTKLTCHTGTWSGTPTHYTFGWLVDGHPRAGSRSSKLAVGRSLHRHRLQCRVTASNAAGSASATSATYRMR
jgi:hypothetical protein